MILDFRKSIVFEGFQTSPAFPSCKTRWRWRNVGGTKLTFEVRSTQTQTCPSVSPSVTDPSWTDQSNQPPNSTRNCLTHCTTSRKIVGSIPYGVIGIFH